MTGTAEELLERIRALEAKVAEPDKDFACPNCGGPWTLPMAHGWDCVRVRGALIADAESQDDGGAP